MWMANVPEEWTVADKRDFVVLALQRLDERLELYSLVCAGALLYNNTTQATCNRLEKEAEETQLPLPDPLPEDPAP